VPGLTEGWFGVFHGSFKKESKGERLYEKEGAMRETINALYSTIRHIL